MPTVTITATPKTASRRKAKHAPSANGNGKAPCDCPACESLAKAKPKLSPATDVPEGRLTKVPIDSIDSSPFNPRTQFDDIPELAATIKRDGILHSPEVRPHPTQVGRYELVFGERRWRAAKLLGWSEMPVMVRPLSDAQARRRAIVENDQRKDTTAIDQAIAYRSYLTADPTMSQSELADMLGTSQGQISNRLRLLELPESVQRHVISGEIPATHARELCKYKAFPELVEKLAAEAVFQAKEEGLPSVDAFADHMVSDVYYGHGRPIKGDSYDSKTRRSVPHFAPTAEEREQLQVIELPAPHGGKKAKMVEAALNTELWKKLQERHAAKWVAETPRGTPRKKAAKEKTKPKAEMTAAEKAAAAKAEAQAAKEREAQFARRLYEWRCDWQRWLIAQEIPDVSVPALYQLLVTAAYQWHPRAMGLPGVGSRKVWDAVKNVDPEAFADQAVEALFWSAKEAAPVGGVPNSDVEAVFKRLGLSMDVAWLNDQAGPLSEAYWAMHTKDQLAAIAAELKIELANAAKAAMVAELLGYRPKPDDKDCGFKMPKEIAKAKRPRGW